MKSLNATLRLGRWRESFVLRRDFLMDRGIYYFGSRNITLS
jgi:hypothetical protein